MPDRQEAHQTESDVTDHITRLVKILLLLKTKLIRSHDMPESEKTVLSQKLSEGPHGLGDPNDRTLRKVEIEVVIPKLMREKAKETKCIEEVAEFGKCCKDSSLLMIIKCRKETSIMKDCLAGWYRNDEFRKECTQEYLDERSEYRRTGIKKPTKRA